MRSLRLSAAKALEWTGKLPGRTQLLYSNGLEKRGKEEKREVMHCDEKRELRKSRIEF